MANVCVLGVQWGDEGKGKIVDWLSEQADVVVRYQGGHNAGHTLIIDGVTYKLSLLPSSVVRGKLAVIGNGVVIDPYYFKAEIEKLKQQNINITASNLRISENASLILPLHQELDAYRENNTKGTKIGTTNRGIGPAYEDKIGRRSIRVADLAEPETLMSKINRLLEHHNILRRGLGLKELKAQDIYNNLIEIAPILLPFMDKSWQILDKESQKNSHILFEGAQGALLDNDFGTYPFVTSSNTIASQAATGSGFPMHKIHYVLGIVKAYTTRVGEGPFPSEQNNEIGEFLGINGHEFGVVTGRKRRCGWFDAVAVRQMIAINGVNGIALTKLDVLDELREIKICTKYELDGKEIDYLPTTATMQQKVKPIYESIEGWNSSTKGIRNLNDLPENALKYVRYIETLISAPVAILSTSPERLDTILIENPFKD